MLRDTGPGDASDVAAAAGPAQRRPGKRPALADGLRAIAQARPHADGAVVLMDGDTILSPGMLRKVLPLFRLEPAVGTVTTNEDGFVHGPPWFANGSRCGSGNDPDHVLVALSEKLLCLTEHLSVFRASVATDPSFAQVENDSIDHWLWGPFEMLSGDDKSTWYWLAAHGHRVCTFPTRWRRPSRWSGLGVEPGVRQPAAVVGKHAAQRRPVMASWGRGGSGSSRGGAPSISGSATGRALVGPAATLLALAAGRYEIAAGYLLWAMATRVGLAAISWRHGRRFSAYYIPLQMFAEWATALIKISGQLAPGEASVAEPRRPHDGYHPWVAIAMDPDRLRPLPLLVLVGRLRDDHRLLHRAPAVLPRGIPVPRVDPAGINQVAIEPAALFRSIVDRTVIVPLIREAPLHSGSRLLPGNGLGAFANVLGYRPVVLPRSLRTGRPERDAPPPQADHGRSCHPAGRIHALRGTAGVRRDPRDPGRLSGAATRRAAWISVTPGRI